MNGISGLFCCCLSMECIDVKRVSRCSA
ncbi:hypothetical protein Golax_004552 [Gossypium laxum]|uniref:Uncharacterized protein n=1 Tax=Gossypium laxum TaxID=34288 RepID=A0A7J9B4S9_9ROSI|nr:hypothetical protein [Gossypium laxum]